ncbi:MAG TPA: hypothetical protein VEC12_06115, partial [Bacteroidia bacterium]|nr:hypothetical protein [Bacteroidia bacterium]
MKAIKLFLLLVLLSPAGLYAQQAEIDSLTRIALSPEDSLKFYERRIVGLGESIIMAKSQVERVTSTYFMAKTLIAALKQPNSYQYPFDSAKKYISILDAPDKSFRIFTWSLKWGKDSLITADSFEFYGAIQMNNPDRLELYGLYDSSARLGKPENFELSNRFWYGALYYQLIMTKHKKQKYYTLLGWDGHDMRSNR